MVYKIEPSSFGKISIHEFQEDEWLSLPIYAYCGYVQIVISDNFCATMIDESNAYYFITNDVKGP